MEIDNIEKTINSKGTTIAHYPISYRSVSKRSRFSLTVEGSLVL